MVVWLSVNFRKWVCLGCTLINRLRSRHEGIHVHRNVLGQRSASVHLDFHLLQLLIFLVAHLCGVRRINSDLGTIVYVVLQLVVGVSRHRWWSHL